MAYQSAHTGAVIDGWNGRIAAAENSITALNNKTGYLPANNAGSTGQFLKKTGASTAAWADVVSVTAQYNGTQNTNMTNLLLFFTDKQVATSAWAADSTYPSYPYKANITCSGVTSNYYAEVTFDLDDAISGFYCPLCSTGSNIVSIYAISVPTAAITIPTIICIKAQ